MAEFRLTKNGYIPVTTIPDDFIENYMPMANGDYVKIYLYMLHCAKSDKMPSISTLADIFQCTENDVKRALKYWESKGLLSLEEVIADRKVDPEEGSYTCYLFEKGLDKILKKVGEECAETIIAAKNGDLTELNGEVNDLIYHLMVMMNVCGLSLDEVLCELEKRAKKIGNLKKMKVVDRNT